MFCPSPKRPLQLWRAGAAPPTSSCRRVVDSKDCLKSHTFVLLFLLLWGGHVTVVTWVQMWLYKLRTSLHSRNGLTKDVEATTSRVMSRDENPFWIDRDPEDLQRSLVSGGTFDNHCSKLTMHFGLHGEVLLWTSTGLSENSEAGWSYHSRHVSNRRQLHCQYLQAVRY